MNNDRFKFRVWDNLRKSYDNLETMCLEQQGGLCYPLPNGGMTAPDEDCEYTIEQCTELRDQNGKLIYEGDIVVQPNEYPYFDYAEGVEHKDLNETLCKIEHDAVPNYIGIVEWDDEDCAFVVVLQCVNPNKSGISNGISYHFSDVQGLEVIGNIHEVKE